MEKLNMLIDFSSPAHKNDLALTVPLIPVPPQIPFSQKEVEEPSVDPFEVQETEVLDPFEIVLQHAANNSNGEQVADEEVQVLLNSKTENILIQIQREDNNSINTFKVENSEKNLEPVFSSSYDNLLNKSSLESDQVLGRNEIPKDCKVSIETSCNASKVHNYVQDAMKNSSKLSVANESESQSQISTDFSTEESLKAVIAKRVRRCIQKVLNGSMPINKNGDSSMFKKPENKRSLSFIGLTSGSAKKECERLNKSCTDVNDSFILEDQKLDALDDSSGFGLLSVNSTDASSEGNGEDQVFKEAHKLSRTFSKLAESFRTEQESDSDDDLLSCKPRWLYTDSSEDEEEKLLKDPSLNFRWRNDDSTCSSSAPAQHNAKACDSPALLAYKSRRSLTQLQPSPDNTQEELAMNSRMTVGVQLKEAPVIPALVSTGPVNLNSDSQPLKLRKKNPGEVKKGPLRAVMPVQSMTKDPVPLASKMSLKQNTSPETTMQKAVYAIHTPNKDNSQLNMSPMASSTPNKAQQVPPLSFVNSKAVTSLLKPVAPVVGNKRHSLEGSFGGHKSREAKPEVGGRPRSNSVNSSIPRVMSVKPMRGLALAPKSTSSLGRAANTRTNANNVPNIPEKKNTSHLKTSVSKARVLTDVEVKSPRQSKVRSAVNTISTLVRGKKSAARDKENRVPA